MPVLPIDFVSLEKRSKSIYEAIVIMSKRARQINDVVNKRFTEELSGVVSESEEEIDNANQKKISLEYEKLPKPSYKALHEFLKGEVEFIYREFQEEEL